MKKPEQNDKHENSRTKRSNKKLANRQRRHAEKMDPENAPDKPILRGYSK